ncbi:MAG: BamA/TamA family outer membrane protein [Burkholderiaceae bacterium]|jgi:translocation and assembly module TamA|nr:BamA/TamA family outer membrane protein [Burkholderiaceae bacterium]
MGMNDGDKNCVNEIAGTRRFGWPLGLCCALLAGCAATGGGTPEQSGAAAQTTSAPSFDVRVDCADDKLRDLVTRFNDLQRYRAVPDLDAAELARLMALAQRQVRDLLATEGYFNPRVTVRREAATAATAMKAAADTAPSVAIAADADAAASEPAAPLPEHAGSAGGPAAVEPVIPAKAETQGGEGPTPKQSAGHADAGEQQTTPSGERGDNDLTTAEPPQGGEHPLGGQRTARSGERGGNDLAAAEPPQGGERPLGGQRTARSGERGGHDLAAARPLVVITIEPGPITRVQQVQMDFTGDIATARDGAATQRAGIRSGWGLQPGQPFTQGAWRDAKTAALRALVERRYPRGRIGASRAEVDAPDAQAKLDVTLDSGPPFYLGAATVEGARRYPADLPQRLSWLKPGDVYDQQKLVDAQQRLAASGYYDSAYISIDPDTNDPAAAPVHYSVTEAKRYKLQLGVGYRTDSGPRASADWRDNTFLGTTLRSETTLRIDPKEPLLQTGLTSLPNANGWRWNTLARVMQQDDVGLTTNSQTLRAGRMQSTPQYDRSVYLQYDNAVVTGSGTASNVLVGDGAAASVNLSWTGRYFDNLLMPRRGFGLSGSVGLGVTTKGKTDPFVRLWGRGLTLIPVGSGGSRFALRTELGALFANAGARVPATFLWRTGGDTTVRGYAYRTIGVHLQQGVIAPGRYLALGSVEYQRPILQQRWPGLLEHVLFVDVGDVANHPNDLRAQVGVGTGLRLITPAGPMELDVAYGVQAHQFRLHMNVGFTF